MRRAFVSHSTHDDYYVAELESFLHAAGFDDVFNDVSAIQPDEQFWPKIEEEITNCDSFFVVITAASNVSEWVKREVEFARGVFDIDPTNFRIRAEFLSFNEGDLAMAERQ